MRMRRCIVASVFLCSSWLNGFSQSSGPAEAHLPSGLRIPAILKTSLSSNKSKVGDPVRLEVMVDVHDQAGNVVIPRHANLFGKVTYVAPYKKKKQPAGLSFAVDRGEWKHQSVTLDAAIFGMDATASDSPKAETVEGIPMATLRSSDTLNVTSSAIMYDFRGDGPQVLHDDTLRTVVMQLKIVPDPAIRTAFVNDKDNIEFRSFLVLLLNGMRVVQ